MKILVTGAAGFIGYYATKVLAARGDEVVGLDNINAYYDTRLKYARLAQNGISQDAIMEGQSTASTCYPNYRFIKLDLGNREALQRLFVTERFDRVCNLAASTCSNVAAITVLVTWSMPVRAAYTASTARYHSRRMTEPIRR